ncbi:MAG TPA: hypothetical protein VL635_14685 [Trinickia sp.]|nr:hypothetical protein [Trinickia sp.]
MSVAAVIRRCHRWIGIVFTLTVVANFVAMAQGKGAPPPWITYSPLAPLALLAVSGLYLFALPYFSRNTARPAPPGSQPKPIA